MTEPKCWRTNPRSGDSFSLTMNDSVFVEARDAIVRGKSAMVLTLAIRKKEPFFT